MFRLRLVPQNRRFYDLIERAGTNMADSGRALVLLLSGNARDEALLERLRALEHVGDDITHEVMRALNQTFVTPLDREDIATLVRTLDDVVDKIWAAALRLRLYEIHPITPIAERFGKLIQEQTEMIARALPMLRNTKAMAGILSMSTDINRIENEADELLHEGLVSSFVHTGRVEDVVLGLKWREIYNYLEEATDAGEDVADSLESIVLKYA